MTSYKTGGLSSAQVGGLISLMCVVVAAVVWLWLGGRRWSWS